MKKQKKRIQLSIFEFEGQTQPVTFIETTQVKLGVECDIYAFPFDNNKDLGIIKIQQDSWTPPQEVLQGEKTVEGYVSGKGKFVVIRKGGKKEEYEVGENPQEKLSVEVKIGDVMQWQADKNSNLTASEVCFPPYSEGCFKNLPDRKI